MDRWKFFDVTHREHVICNPLSVAKVDELVHLLRLSRGARVVDIASGKGELLVRLAETYGVSGVGVDLSPHFIEAARRLAATRVPDARIEFVEMDGAEFAPGSPASVDLAVCLGASWIFDGYRGTLEELARMVTPGGWIVVGEPYWIATPPRAYLAAIGESRDAFGTHPENVEAGEALALRLVYTLVSSPDDWDRYEGLQWYATDRFVREQPDDPDVPELCRRVDGQRAAYLRWGRDTLGWAVYMFRKP